MPYSDGPLVSGGRDSITVGRELGRPQSLLVFECLYFFATRDIPNYDCAFPGPRDKFRRIRREIDGVDFKILLVFPDCFVCFDVPHEHLAPVRRPRDPFLVLRHGETKDIHHFDRCHPLAVLHLPHLNVLV